MAWKLWVNIGLSYGLLQVWHQANISTNVDISSTEPPGSYVEFRSQYPNFFKKNTFETKYISFL